jgi:hypothetical protein
MRWHAVRLSSYKVLTKINELFQQQLLCNFTLHDEQQKTNKDGRVILRRRECPYRIHTVWKIFKEGVGGILNVLYVFQFLADAGLQRTTTFLHLSCRSPTHHRGYHLNAMPRLFFWSGFRHESWVLMSSSRQTHNTKNHSTIALSRKHFYRTDVGFQRTTRRYIAEDSTLLNHHCKNLKILQMYCTSWFPYVGSS